MRENQFTRHLPFHALLEALEQPGCPLCWLAARAVERALEGLSYENINDPEVQREFRSALGLCARHGWQWVDRLHSGQGAAILYGATATTALTRLRAGRNGSEPPGGLLALVLGARPETPPEVAALTPEGPCPMCRVRDETARRAAEVLRGGLKDAEFKAAYDRSDGVCIPHLRWMLADARSADQHARQALVERAMARLEQLRGELAEYVRKHDYRFQHEPYGSEREAPLRALAFFAGERGVW